MKIVFLSDTHTCHDNIDVPDGDVLIHAGDMSWDGKLDAVLNFNQWLESLNHNKKIFVPGNHDFCFEEKNKQNEAINSLTEAECLIDKSFTIGDVEVWGAPWQPKFFNWAFNKKRGKSLRKKWNLIPETTDILVTHGPPRGIGDRVSFGDRVGCQELRKRIDKVEPDYHLFGHIHEGYGRYQENGITFVNGSVCDVNGNPRNTPIVIEYSE